MGAIPIARFRASRSDRLEMVHYWIRVGNVVPLGSYATRASIFSSEMRGKVPDGTLVRTSVRMADDGAPAMQAASNILHAFNVQLLDASDQGLRDLFIA